MHSLFAAKKNCFPYRNTLLKHQVKAPGMSLPSSIFKTPNSVRLSRELRLLQVFASAWASKEEACLVNAPDTYPLPIVPRNEILAQVARANPTAPQLTLSLKQNLAYVKSLLQFYKAGVKNVWNNRTKVNTLRRESFAINRVNKDGKEISAALPSFQKLTCEMALALHMSQMELEVLIRNKAGHVKKSLAADDIVDKGIFKLSRAQYQLLRRTQVDFPKIPFFAVVALVCAEMTPLLCYAVPEITPLTCLLPSLLPRLWGAQLKQNLSLDMSQKPNWDKIPWETAYSLPLDRVQRLCQSLRLVSRFVPISLYSDKRLRDLLHQHYQYLKVDNYYLLGLNSGGNLWNLDDSELILACLERGLVKDLKAVQGTSGDSDLTKSALLELRVKLLQFLVDSHTRNVGYLDIALPVSETINIDDFLKLRPLI